MCVCVCVCVCVCIYIYSFFRFFPLKGYYTMLNVAPRAIEQNTPGHRPVQVRGLVGTGPRRRRWVAGTKEKLHLDTSNTLWVSLSPVIPKWDHLVIGK